MPLHRASGRGGLGLALAISTMLLWGLLPIALEVALGYLDALTLTALRFAVAAALLALWLGRRGRLPRPAAFRRGWPLLALAAVGLASNFLGFLTGLERTSAANAQVLIQIAPLLLGFGGIAIFGERYNRLQWLGVALLVTGLALFFRAQWNAASDDTARFLAGSALLLFAAITWALYGLAQKQLLLHHASPGLMCWIYALCALLLLPGAQPAALFELPASAWPWVGFCALNTLVAYGAFAASLEHLEASRVSAVIALTPIATLAFTSLGAAAWPGTFEAQSLGLAQWLGGAMVVAGGMTTSLAARPGARPPVPALPGARP